MNTEQKKRIAHEISNWKNACNCRAVQLTGDRMAALLQELVNTSEPDGWLPGGFRIEHFAKDDLSLTDEANAERRFFVKRIEPPYHKDGVWFGATAGEALAKACAAIGLDYTAPAHAELPTWENGDDPLVGGGLISRGKVDFTALGIWPSKPAPDGLPLLISGAVYDFAGFLTTREKTIQVGARVGADIVVDLLKEWAALRGLKLDDAAVLSWQEWLSPTPPEPPADVARDAEPVAYVTGYYAGYLSIATIDGRVLPAGTALFTTPPAPSVPEVATATNPSQISSSAEPFGYFKAEPFGWTDCAETDDGAIALYTAPPAPSVPDGWRYVIPGRRRTEKSDSSRVGDYNQGWNDCRGITEKALNDLEKRK